MYVYYNLVGSTWIKIKYDLMTTVWNIYICKYSRADKRSRDELITIEIKLLISKLLNIII